MEAEKQELIHAKTLEIEELVSKYEAEKNEAQEELELIFQVMLAVLENDACNLITL